MGQRAAACLLVFVSSLLVSGCGGPKPVHVNGTVTLDGNPLPKATITFVPLEQSTGRQAGGKADDSGYFELTTFSTGDGALPGEYKVIVDLPDTTVQEEFFKRKPGDPENLTAVMMMRRNIPDNRKKLQEAMRKAPRSPVPSAYRNVKTTPLREVVPTNGSLTLELKRGAS